MVADSKTQVKPNSGRFLEAFNKIEAYLRKKTGETIKVPFYILVDKISNTSPAVRYFSTDLKEFADLRNAIVHETTDGHVIAEPNDDSVRHLEYIASILLKPPTVIPLFEKHVSTLTLGDSLAKVVRLMYQNSFSQIPIYSDKRFVALLTTNTISRWLGSVANIDILSLSETTIENVLKFSEDQDNYFFLSRNSTVFDVIDKFLLYEKKGKRLEALLITENGKADETILGIITIWDLPQIYQKLEY